MEEKYIDYGKIRPTVENGWSKNNSYERLTFVKYGAKTYISTKDVPKDIELSNEEYWLLLIDGGEIVLKEDKSNKKNSLNYNDENYYPNIIAVKNAIAALNIDNKLDCYKFDSSSNNICIKKQQGSIKFILSIVDHDNSENNSFYYVDDNLMYISLGCEEVWFNFKIYNSHTVDDNEDVLDEYIHLDFSNSNDDLSITLIPLPNSGLEIETNVEGLIIDDTFELIHFNKDISLIKNNEGGIQQNLCNAHGDKSLAIGDNTFTKNIAEVACGKNNISILNKTIHTIGIGLSAQTRKNAQLITIDGKHYIIGVGNFTGQETTSSELNNCQDLAKVIDDIATDIEDIKNDVEGAIFDCDNWAGGGTFGILSLNEIQQIYNYYRNNISVKIRKTSDNKLQDIIACDMTNNELYTKDWTISDAY